MSGERTALIDTEQTHDNQGVCFLGPFGKEFHPHPGSPVGLHLSAQKRGDPGDTLPCSCRWQTPRRGPVSCLCFMKKLSSTVLGFLLASLTLRRMGRAALHRDALFIVSTTSGIFRQAQSATSQSHVDSLFFSFSGSSLRNAPWWLSVAGSSPALPFGGLCPLQGDRQVRKTADSHFPHLW